MDEQSSTGSCIDLAFELFDHPLDDEVRELVFNCYVDWVSASAATTLDRDAEILRTIVNRDVTGSTCHVLGSNGRYSTSDAALLSGALAHLLDYDDVNLIVGGHLTAVILSAVVAIGQDEQLRLNEVLRAFLAGYEVAVQIGVRCARACSERGFHSTSVLGGIGAAVGAAVLLGASRTQMSSALGIAVTDASGLKAVFGTLAKPLHAGLAARRGVEAAKWAICGIDTPKQMLDIEGGLYSTFGGASGGSAQLTGGLYGGIAKNRFKYYASCFGTQAAISCAERIHEDARAHQGITRIVVRAATVNKTVCGKMDPRNPRELKFSIAGTVALTICGYDLGLEENFNSIVLQDSTYRRVLNCIEIIYVPEYIMTETRIHVYWSNSGSATEYYHDSAELNETQDCTRRRLYQKLRRLMTMNGTGASLVGALERQYNNLNEITLNHAIDELKQSSCVAAI